MLARGFFRAGEHDAAWDGRDVSGRPAASGTYFVRMKVGTSFVESRTITLLK
jgi:flagellar hook assembly protein FlgD